MKRVIDINSIRPLIIAGPCGAETREQTLAAYRELAATGLVHIVRAGVWKPRTAPGGFEGAGEQALEWLSEGKRATGLPFGVEVANARHTEAALKHGADMVWIGARTTVNPFNVQEIADAVAGAGVKVFVKNPLHPDTELWSGAVERILRAVPRRDVGLIHRGFAQAAPGGYRNPPLWHLAVGMRQRYPDLVMLCDPSHISGRREYVADVARKAADLFFDGLIVESHCDPAAALSDASQQLTPADLKVMLESITWRTRDTANPSFTEMLASCRAEIDSLDAEIFGLLSRRMAIAENIGSIKRDNSVTILQELRWNTIMDNMLSRAVELGLSPEFIRAILDAVHFESIAHQNKIDN